MKEPKFTLVEHFCNEDEPSRKDTFCNLISKVLSAKEMQPNEQTSRYIANPDDNQHNSLGV